jgi:hypothetical protein
MRLERDFVGVTGDAGLLVRRADISSNPTATFKVSSDLLVQLLSPCYLFSVWRKKHQIP